MQNSKKCIAVFASGSGSNAEQLILQSQQLELNFYVKLIVTNNSKAGVVNIAHNYGVPCFYWDVANIKNSENFVRFLKKNNVDLIVLAGYLKKIDKSLIEAFPNKIINIHPALLPKFGGKGMYGMHVHEAVIAAKEKTSGITIHFVNENYDEGNIIAQFSCDIDEDDNQNSLQKKVLALEHQNFYKTINEICSK